MRRTIPWIAAASALVLAGIALDAARAPGGAARHTSLLTALQSVGTTFAPGDPIAATLLLQRQDCSGNLRLLTWLNHARQRGALRLTVLWHVGPPRDSVAIRALLPRWTRSIPLLPAPQAALDDLKRLGHRSTPVLLLQDEAGRIRLATQSPRSPREAAGLRRAIEGLTWMEDLP
jgi:hypothetical protein